MKPIPEDDLRHLCVTGPQLADIVGVKTETVVRYAKEQGMPKAARGRYPLIACIRWVMSLRQPSTIEDGLGVERKRLVIEQRRRAEIENAHLRDELIDADLVSGVFNTVMAAIATQIDGLGPRLAGELATVDDPAVISRRLHDESRAIRRNVCGEVADICAAIIQSDDDGAAAAAPRRRVGRRAPSVAAGLSRAGAVADE